MEEKKFFEGRDESCFGNCALGVEMRDGKVAFKRQICPYCRLYAKKEDKRCSVKNSF